MRKSCYAVNSMQTDGIERSLQVKEANCPRIARGDMRAVGLEGFGLMGAKGLGTANTAVVLALLPVADLLDAAGGYGGAGADGEHAGPGQYEHGHAHRHDGGASHGLGCARQA